mgnify:CR=1 FL=1
MESLSNMNENGWQKIFIEFLHRSRPTSTFVPKIRLPYSIGKYHKGKEFGMPDTEIDIVEFDANNQFHLWELKLLESPEVWNGKFLGQIMLYDYLFRTEPWTEILGRFLTKQCKGDNGIKGNFQRITDYLVSCEAPANVTYSGKDGDEIIDGAAIHSFKSWNLVVCGGCGYELAAGYNPVIWSYYALQDDYFKKDTPSLEIHHFYKIVDGYDMRSLPDISVLEKGSVHPDAWGKFCRDFPDFFDTDTV